MPETKESKEQKELFYQKIEKHLGRLYKYRNRNFIRHNQTDNISFFTTFSIKSNMFFDISENDLKLLEKYSNAFVCFLIGSCDHVICFPLHDLRVALEMHHKTTDAGDYKLHFEEVAYGFRLKELPDLNIMKHYNNIDVSINLQQNSIKPFPFFSGATLNRTSLASVTI